MTTTEVGGLESPAEVTPALRDRLPCFDGFRAIAACSVLVTHVAFLSGFTNRSRLGALTARMDVGVPVFFLISGFLLYRPFVAARLARRSQPRLGGYFWRRALRILPAYWFALTAVVFVLGVPERVPNGGDLALYYPLVHLYSVGNFISSPILSSYTLVTEIAFYLFLPVYALVLDRLHRSPDQRVRVEAVALGTVFLVSTIYRLAVTFGFDGEREGQLSNVLPGWLDAFALGMGLAVASAWLAHRRRPAPFRLEHPAAPAVAWTLSLATLVTLAAWIGRPGGFTIYSDWEQLEIHWLYLLTALLFLLPGVFGPQDRGAVRAFLTWRPVVWLGLVSYGLYLWNEPLMEKWLTWTDRPHFNASFGTMLLGVFALSLAAAVVSYFVVERPALTLKRLVPERSPRAAGRSAR